ncbi:MAG: hypothetical protein ACRDKI_08335 [Solirubrobacterales bacterium]
MLGNVSAETPSATGVVVSRGSDVVPDTTAPALKITAKPKKKSTKRKSKIKFSANEAATYKCKLDKGKFKSCSSPYTAKVKPGKHKLTIVATDAAGNASPPMAVRWKVARTK